MRIKGKLRVTTTLFPDSDKGQRDRVRQCHHVLQGIINLTLKYCCGSGPIFSDLDPRIWF